VAAACGGKFLRVGIPLLQKLYLLSAVVGGIVGLVVIQLCFGQTLAWGQYVLGLGISGFVFAPLFGVNPAFGNLLEIGFQGVHGTVGGIAVYCEWEMNENKWQCWRKFIR
jgi:Na+/glutamate symporter